ncbi:MAG: DTW domain-containing protein [Verrucomicrobia bacterium]|nr:DTW domain-containing protein [Verrucomicrobiota bacterium]
MSLTYIIRHTRENLKKCSLRGLEGRPGLTFFSYPECALGKETLPPLDNVLLLDLSGRPLTREDSGFGLILLDGTWKLAQKMAKNCKELHGLSCRSIPAGFQTAYPRCQHDCPDPSQGLASIEALYVAFSILGYPVEGLLDGYYWKEQFLEKNREIFLLNNIYQ